MKKSAELKESAILSNPNAWHVRQVCDGYVIAIVLEAEDAAVQAEELTKKWGRKYVAAPNS